VHGFLLELNVKIELPHIFAEPLFVLGSQRRAVLSAFDAFGHTGGKHHAGKLSAFFAINLG
jgi:hypothetical protein